MDAMLARMSSGQLAEWEAFYTLEPWGSEMDDHRFGMLAATTYNMNRGPSARAMDPWDFFPRRAVKPLTLSQRIVVALGEDPSRVKE